MLFSPLIIPLTKYASALSVRGNISQTALPAGTATRKAYTKIILKTRSRFSFWKESRVFKRVPTALRSILLWGIHVLTAPVPKPRGRISASMQPPRGNSSVIQLLNFNFKLLWIKSNKRVLSPLHALVSRIISSRFQIMPHIPKIKGRLFLFLAYFFPLLRYPSYHVPVSRVAHIAASLEMEARMNCAIHFVEIPIHEVVGKNDVKCPAHSRHHQRLVWQRSDYVETSLQKASVQGTSREASVSWLEQARRCGVRLSSLGCREK